VEEKVVAADTPTHSEAIVQPAEVLVVSPKMNQAQNRNDANNNAAPSLETTKPIDPEEGEQAPTKQQEQPPPNKSDSSSTTGSTTLVPRIPLPKKDTVPTHARKTVATEENISASNLSPHREDRPRRVKIRVHAVSRDGKNIRNIKVYPTMALSTVGVGIGVDTTNTDTSLDAGASANAGEAPAPMVATKEPKMASTPAPGKAQNTVVIKNKKYTAMVVKHLTRRCSSGKERANSHRRQGNDNCGGNGHSLQR